RATRESAGRSSRRAAAAVGRSILAAAFPLSASREWSPAFPSRVRYSQTPCAFFPGPTFLLKNQRRSDQQYGIFAVDSSCSSGKVGIGSHSEFGLQLGFKLARPLKLQANGRLSGFLLKKVKEFARRGISIAIGSPQTDANDDGRRQRGLYDIER